MAMDTEKVARRYSRALFDACAPTDLDQVRTLVDELALAWKEHPSFREALISPAVSLPERQAVVRSLVDAIEGVSSQSAKTSVSNFGAVLLENRQIASLPVVAKRFSQLVDEYKKILNVQVTSAFNLPDSERANIQKQLQQGLGSPPAVSWSVDPELIGGLVIQIGDRVLDSSVASSLQKVRAQLSA